MHHHASSCIVISTSSIPNPLSLPFPTHLRSRLNMADPATMDIGLFGQLPDFQIYTQLTYLFAGRPEDDSDASRAAVADTLRAGLGRLVAAFPWLGGQVVRDAAAGRLRFAPYADGARPQPQLVVRDLTAGSPGLTWDALAAAGFPMRLLDERAVAPRLTLPGLESDPAFFHDRPVLVVQAGFVRGGGVLVTVVAHHAALDMAGQDVVAQWLSAAFRGERFSESDLAVGNRDRADVVPALAADEPGADNPAALIPQQVRSAAEVAALAAAAAPPPPPANPPVATWFYVAFSAASRAALKAAATASLPPASDALHAVPYVSTDDVLTALLWQAVVRARLLRLPAADVPSALARAVDVRAYVPGTTARYPGLCSSMLFQDAPSARALAAAPLGHVAARLRAAVRHGDHGQRTRALATAVRAALSAHDTSAVAFAGKHVDVAAGGLMLSSWARVATGLGFGLGRGAPAAVRRPAFTPVEGLLYLMPADGRDGRGVQAAALCLREEDLARLRADAEFRRYAEYVG